MSSPTPATRVRMDNSNHERQRQLDEARTSAPQRINDASLSRFVIRTRRFIAFTPALALDVN